MAAVAEMTVAEMTVVYGRGGGRGGYRSERDRGGRGGYGRGMNGGRGGGADRDRRRERGSTAAGSGDRERRSVPQEKKEAVPGPAPVKTEQKLQGAWGQRAAAQVAPAAPAPLPAMVEVKPVTGPVSGTTPVPAPVEPEPTFDVGVVTPEDPTPAGLVENTDVIQTAAVPSPTPKAAVPPSGNVWATKGSAHIIQAEKPKPKSPQPVSKPTKTREKPRQPKPQPIVEQIVEPTESTEPTIDSNSTLPEPVKEDPIVSPPPTTTTSTPLDTDLPASVNGANINAAGWNPKEGLTTSSVDMVQPSPVGPVSVASTSVVDAPLLETTEPVQETIVVPEEPAPTLSVPTSIESSLKPSSALNLGHWGETNDGEDNLSHEYGFGYVQDNDVVSLDEATHGSTTGANNVTSVPQPTPAAPQPAVTETVPAPTTSTVSPARVPPGLGIGRPLPDKIVHVHELENKLESASLAAKKNEVTEKVDIVKASTKDASSSTTSNNTYTPGGQPVNNNEAFVQMPPAGIMSQNYSGQYGMGMYNYNGQNPAVAAPNGFMGVPNQAAPLLSSGVLPQQQKQQTVNAQQQGVGLPQQANLYGAPAPANNTLETSTNSDSSTANPSANNAGMPPGIPNGIPYNPALFYGQQPYQMGQHHGVAGAYGFAAYGGQYGGVQSGFGYQQVMGQSGGYQPYDDQGHNGNHANHSNNSNHQGGYNKNSGGYRGRNNHNNLHHNQHNQYQNQYNPQGPGGYGNQPYAAMAYTDFSQRGGYPGGHMDSSYMQNSGGYQSGFNQDDGQQMSKGKSKGGNRNFGSNPNMNQYQQSQQQQFGGLQGAGSGGVSDSTGNLYNQNWS